MREHCHSACQSESNIRLKPSFEPNNNNGLSAEPWCMPTFTSKQLQFHKLFQQLFCTCVHRHDCQYQPFFNSQLTHCPSYHFSWNPIKSLLQIHKAKTELPSFNSKILLHLSCNKNGISGSFTFTNPNCRSSTSICCRIPCSKILSTTFIACSNNLIPL